ncbi:cupin domain-containing protein [Halorubrum aethiopicum]|uniref:cupin domain-containing protein n=1 Tax=Halorubrum aethiopicum TaxID=1758255 RepID=UPI0009B59FCE|nr:cupin domain-containing protein [Halorubrum aethiopicum]
MSDRTQHGKYSVSVGLDRNLGAELKVAPGDGDNDVAVVEHTLPPEKLAAPLHRHNNEDEISYILQGRMGVQEEDEVSIVEAGEAAVKERGVWHTFWNPGPEQLRFLEIITPGEFAWYFAETDTILPESGEPDGEAVEQLAELHARYDFELDPESVPQLLERHGLDTGRSE